MIWQGYYGAESMNVRFFHYVRCQKIRTLLQKCKLPDGSSYHDKVAAIAERFGVPEAGV